MRFQGMDTNRNGQIERSEWNGSDQSFNVHDWNNDGVLSREEVRLGGRRGAQIAAEDDFNPNGPATWTARNFTLLDRNRDNRISSNEWYYAAEYFRRADRDRNGSLSAQEFTGGGTGTGTVWDDDRDDRFENLDVNNNGRIEQREWHGTLDAFRWLDRNNDNWLSQAEVVGETSEFVDLRHLLEPGLQPQQQPRVCRVAVVAAQLRPLRHQRRRPADPSGVRRGRRPAAGGSISGTVRRGA